MKYINFLHIGIVVFEGHISHADMARRINDEVISAGMVDMDELNPPMCYGNSHTLGVKSFPDDTMVLRRRLGLSSPSNSANQPPSAAPTMVEPT